ncbi:hypothetical protein [Burkholderia sp. RF4-BP95]|uniref:hypothetical protein n=1 Tax=Burkholderia sp. RF4-BP95 TaxID=1637845 RepID=UPI000AD6B87C|nr:hypothetical protein [Burkholderia sp. RF4-BP95]
MNQSTAKSARYRFLSRHLPQVALLTATASILAACGRRSDPAQAMPPSSTVPVTLTIGTPIAGAATLSSAVAGLSFEKGLLSKGVFSGSNTALIALFKELGPSVLRIGGNSADKTIWDEGGDINSHGLTAGYTAPSDVGRLADFPRATGWKVIYGINFTAETPAQMSREAAYVSSKFGESLAGFELGNEPDLYSRNGHRSSSYTFGDFLSESNADANAIQSAVITPAFTGPAPTCNYKGYTLPFAAAAGNRAHIFSQRTTGIPAARTARPVMRRALATCCRQTPACPANCSRWQPRHHRTESQAT